MISPTRFLPLAFLLCFAFVPFRNAAAQSDRPAEGRWLCFSGYENNPIYVTPVWNGTHIGDEVQAAFKQNAVALLTSLTGVGRPLMSGIKLFPGFDRLKRLKNSNCTLN